jgi:hypothetical protein
MALDLQNTLNDIKSRIGALKTTNEVLSDFEEARQKVKDNLEQAEKNVIDAVDKVKDTKSRLKKEIKGQLPNLLEIFSLNAGNGNTSFNYLKSAFIKTLNRCEPVIREFVTEVMIDCAGCSEEQQYDTQKPIYIKVSSIDLNKQLLNYKPDVDEGKLLYEAKPAVNGEFPYSMNKELWNRLQKENSLFSSENNNTSFLGKSGQALFDMKYVKTNEYGETGDFLEITLSNRANNINNISNFLFDYYTSISILDLNSVYTRLIDLIFGAFSMKTNVGYDELVIQNKIALIIQRILGLCYDKRKEIDVSGVSKLSELDNIDESFFEFSDIDLRTINQTCNNIQNGVVEFEDCDNVKLPVDPQQTLSILDQITFVSGTDNNLSELDKLAEKLANANKNNSEWRKMFPNQFDMELEIDKEFLKKLPKALVLSLFSPKLLLGLFIMLKALGNEIVDLIENAMDFFKKFIKCLSKLISKIQAIFIEQLFLLLKRDLLKLINKLVKEISKKKIAKKYILIGKLVAILGLLVKSAIDWRQCKSVLDEILLILNIVMLGNNSGLSPVLLAGAGFLPGYSAERALSNVIEEYQKTGLPTGTGPDGRPNLNFRGIKSFLDGEELERLNQKGGAFIPPIAVPPWGSTISPFTISLIPSIP